MQFWQRGEVPLLNDFILGGQSLIADVAAGIFYPFNWLLVRTWTDSFVFNYWLLELFVIAHLAIAAAGMYWLVRRVWRLGRSSAVIAALVFAFSNFFILHLKHVGMVLSGVWLPLIFGNYLLWRKERKVVYLWWTALFLIFSNLGGHIQIVYYLYLFLGWYLIWSLFEIYSKKNGNGWLRDVTREAVIMAILLVVGIGGAAVQYLPFWQMLSESVRSSSDYIFSSSFSLDFGQYLINLFLPHIFGGYGFGVSYNGRGNYWENVNYVGIATLVLLAFSWLFIKKEKWIRFGWATVLVFLLLAFGDNFFLHFVATKVLWGFDKLRAPARLALIVNFAFAILSAFSWYYLSHSDHQVRQRVESWLKLAKKYAVYFVLLWLVVASVLWLSRWKLGELGLGEVVGLFWLLLVSGWLFWWWRGWSQGKITSSFLAKILMITLAVDLFYFGFKFNQGKSDPTVYYAYYPELNYLAQTITKEERAMFVGSYTVNVGMIRGVNFFNGHHYIFTSRLEDLSGGNFHFYLNNYLTPSPYLLTLYNIRYVLNFDNNKTLPSSFAPLTSILYENRDRLGPVWLVREVIVENNEQVLLTKVKTDNLQQRAYLEEGGGWWGDLSFTYQLLTYQKKDNRISFIVESSKPALAVISQSWLPGWQAWVNGQLATVRRVNYNLLGVVVPAGVTEVKLVYQPISYQRGLVISTSIWLLMVVVGAGCYLKQAWPNRRKG